MACILKAPGPKSPGILSITTGEWYSNLRPSKTLYHAFEKLKPQWLIGLHHNTAHADHNFKPDPLFDFHIAAPGDLKSANNEPFCQIEMDCSNFCGDNFEFIPGHRKHWDFLIVSRNVNFKSLDDLFLIVRNLFDKQKMRVLAIVAHENLHEHGCGRSDTIDTYLKLFNVEERKYFTLLTPSIDYPFPFDLETLSYFYHSSRVFLHVAKKERHPRVVAYAWASGMPVVAPKEVGCLLPPALQNPPGFFHYQTLEQAAKNLNLALDISKEGFDNTDYVKHHLSSYQKTVFKKKFSTCFNLSSLDPSGRDWFLERLDLRLARHQYELPYSLFKFAHVLDSLSSNELELLDQIDPEYGLSNKANMLSEPSVVKWELFKSDFKQFLKFKPLKRRLISFAKFFKKFLP